MQDQQHFKLVVIGSVGTGKTNISKRFIHNQYNEGAKGTVGVELLVKKLRVRQLNVKLTVWDTAGQERFKSLSKNYYKGASGIIIVYDVTDPQSYLDVESWMRLANQNLDLSQVVLMLVGNKIDLDDDRKVPSSRVIAQYGEPFDIDCREVSAKTGENVPEVFNELLDKIYDQNFQSRYVPAGEDSGNGKADKPSRLSGQDPGRYSGNGRFSTDSRNSRNIHLDENDSEKEQKKRICGCH